MLSGGARSTQNATEIVVAVNGNYFGGLESLRQFSIGELDGLRYLDSGTAASEVRGVGPGVHIEAAVLVEFRAREVDPDRDEGGKRPSGSSPLLFARLYFNPAGSGRRTPV